MNDDTPEADVSEVSSPVSLPVISLLSPKAMETAGCIVRFEEKHREKAMVRLCSVSNVHRRQKHKC